jgi:hypothetical protein
MTAGANERELQAYARLAGAAYLLQNVLFFASSIIMSRMTVVGDFAATARNIAASKSLYRLGVSIGLLASAATIVLAWAFYVLLKRVDRNLALFGLLFRTTEAVFYGILFLFYFVALDICQGAANGFDAAGQQAL